MYNIITSLMNEGFTLWRVSGYNLLNAKGVALLDNPSTQHVYLFNQPIYEKED